MAGLQVGVSAKWGGGVDFHQHPILVAISVTDVSGNAVTGLNKSGVRVRYQDRFNESNAASTDSFFEHVAVSGIGGIYSLLARPSVRQPGQGWPMDELLLFVGVRHEGNRGQSLCSVRFRSIEDPVATATGKLDTVLDELAIIRRAVS